MEEFSFFAVAAAFLDLHSVLPLDNRNSIGGQDECYPRKRGDVKIPIDLLISLSNVLSPFLILVVTEFKTELLSAYDTCFLIL
jgi:hypothetical protein